MASGIVRRIDELGRIVIPKEMRKTMRLQVGDEMEISSSGDALTLRRYSGFQSVRAEVKAVAKELSKAVDADVLFASANAVAVAEGKNKKTYENARLTDSFCALVRERKADVLHGEDLNHIFEDRACGCAFVVVEPVVAGGDLIGAAMMLIDSLPSDVARAYLHFCVQLIEASLG